MEIGTIINQMLMLFIIMAVGYLAAKVKILAPDQNRILTQIVMSVTLPCTIIDSVTGGDLAVTGGETLRFLLISFVIYAVMVVIALPVPKLLRAESEDAGVYRFNTAFANVGFMGIPVISAIYGSGSVFYVAVYNIPFNVLVYSLGVIFIAGRGEKLNFKKLINPALISVVVSMVLLFAKIPVPAPVKSAVSLLGNVTTPAAMLVVGATLATVPLREVFSDGRVYIATAIRLLIIPVITWLVLRMFITDSEMLGILVLLGAMPTATVGTMLSTQYGGNEKLAAKNVFLSSLLSVVTVPLLVYLLF